MNKVEVKVEEPKKPRGQSPEFLKYKGKIAEIRKNMTPEQLEAMKEKRLKTQIAKRMSVPNSDNVRLWLWDELTKPREGGCTANRMLTNINNALRNPDMSVMSQKEYLKLCMDMLKFVAGSVNDKHPNTAVQVNVQTGKENESVVKNVIEIPEYRDKMNNVDLSMLDSMNTEEIQKFIDEDEDGED